ADMIRPVDLEFIDIPTQILKISSYMLHFKVLLLAIDEVHMHVCISPLYANPYIGRKEIPTQNVSASCNVNMQFTFCLAS
ncbi:hypothetical protein CFOL_v3_27737, partial [Cephalotus follicularis]